MDKGDTIGKNKKSGVKSKFGALRRGLKLERAPSPKIKDDKIVKPNATFSLIKKLKLGKSVSNPALGSPQVYLASEVEKRGTLENTPSISSVSTDAASSSGHTRSFGVEMSGSATDNNPLTEQGDTASASASSTDAATPQPTTHDDEEDSYESFHETDNNQHDTRLSIDNNAASKNESSNIRDRDDNDNSDNKVPSEMPAFSDLIYDKQQENAQATSSVTQFPQERREHLYKLLVIGELGTGKTSIIKRYVHQFFSQHYRATIGVDFALKVLNWDANTVIRLQLWDIAGQERFGNMTRVYYKDAVGAFIVFDATRVATFDAVVKWKQDLDSKVQLPDGSPIPCVLLGNKCDQQKEGMINIPSKMDEYCKEKGFAGWFETSAKENINIEEAAKFLVNKILLNDKLLCNKDANKDTDRIAIDGKGNNKQKPNNLKSCNC